MDALTIILYVGGGIAVLAFIVVTNMIADKRVQKTDSQAQSKERGLGSISKRHGIASAPTSTKIAIGYGPYGSRNRR